MASTSTFVSCKDYDDDIQNLQAQIDANSKAIAEIQKLIQSGSVITNVSSTTNGVTVTLSNGNTFDITNGKNGDNGKDGSVVTIGDNGNWFIDGKDTGLAAQGPKGDKGDKGEPGAAGDDAAVKGEWYALSADFTKLEYYKDGVKDDSKSIEIADLVKNAGVVNAVKTDDVLTLYNVSGSEEPIVIALNSTLHSLVFKPEFYYWGIEAMAAYIVNYNENTLTTESTAAAPLEEGEVWETADEESYVSPLVVARYHMNPSYFDVKKIKSIGFVYDDKTYVTRAAEDLNPVATAWEGEEDGILAVKIKMNAEKIAGAAEEGDVEKVTVLAAQVKLGNDSIVTSDYAALTKTDITNVVVADKDKEDTEDDCEIDPGCFHVYTSAADAIDADPTHKLVWNAEEATDLNDFVVAHLKVGEEEREVAPANVKDYGMKFEYAASHYKSGSNNTSESVHMDIQGSKVKACMPNADGTAADPANQNEASIGRMPMVRVILRDTVNNKVVALGFIKFEISREADAPADDIVREFGNPNGHELCCDGYEKQLTWTEVEHEVLSYLHLSKAEFEERYALAETDGECTQYYKDEDGEWAEATAPIKTGKVENVENTGDHETSVLKWTILGTEVYDSVYDATAGAYKQNVELTTTVKFKPKDSYQSLPAVYVTFNSGKISTPSATWGNANKIKENWAAKNGAMGSGYVEIHNNVEVVGQTNADCKFKNDILNTLYGNKVTLGEINGSDSFADENISYTFKFIIKDYSELTGASGQVYTMSVSEDGTKLQAMVKDDENETLKDVAVLSTSQTGITNGVANNLIEYQTSDYALDILNAAGHKDLANTASATIGLFAENGCDMVLPIADNTFDVKFLRPLDVKGATTAEFTDAIDGGNVLKLGELAVFNDWRDQWFCDATHDCYYAYYEVSKIEPDLDNVTTTLNGGTLGTTKLSEVNPNLSLTANAIEVTSYVDSDNAHTATHNYGTLTYNNNGQNTAAFKLRVPLKITYKWGVVTDAYVDINVAATHNQ